MISTVIFFLFRFSAPHAHPPAMKRITRGGELVTAAATSFDTACTPYGGLAGSDVVIPSEYPCRLNTYTVPPSYDISIEQFEEYAFARLQVLKAIENASMRFQRDDDLAKAIKSVEDKWLPLHSNESAAAYNLFEERRRDQASHFILRLAFCNTADNIRWFVTHECLLFRIRFAYEMSKERTDFLRHSNAGLVPIDAEERREVMDDLRKCSPGREQDDFYQVPFELVPDLVARRAVFLRAGWAYVPKCDSFSIIMTRFRENLEFWMERTARELPGLRDERILPLLQLVKTTDSSAASDTSRGFVEGKLTANDLEAASAHFPLCMQQLYQNGKRENHLKYGGRQQLGLFLKGIGLSLEEAVIFWKRLFVPKCGEDGFNKSYLYNVRHNYGQEGKRANYGPTPCSKIITGTAPGVGDHHGCPFRHASADPLYAMLTAYQGPTGAKLNGGQVEEIAEMAKGNHCQAACTRLFEYTRRPDQPPGYIETFAYPSKFFEASVKLTKGNAGSTRSK